MVYLELSLAVLQLNYCGKKVAESGLETCVVGDCVVDVLINLLICVVINELEKNKDRNPFCFRDLSLALAC